MPPDGFPPEVLTAEAGTVENCPALPRVRAFVASQGVTASLLFVARDAGGTPVSLSAYAAGGSVSLRCKEAAVPSPSCDDPVLESDGAFGDPASGQLYGELTPGMVAAPGVYQLSFGVFDAGGRLAKVFPALLSVEPTLFGDPSVAPGGCPSLGEIRMALRDSAPNENLLLREHEFGDDQIVQALVRPVRYFNEQPPPLRPFSTRDFPFREMWLRAVCGRLYEVAAAGYRRNQLAYQAGGVSVDDQNKEQQYLAAAQAIDAEWRQFVFDKKLQMNHALFSGYVDSPYGWGHW